MLEDARDLDSDIEEVQRVIAESEHTRLPVYREHIDQVIGVLHLRTRWGASRISWWSPNAAPASWSTSDPAPS